MKGVNKGADVGGEGVGFRGCASSGQLICSVLKLLAGMGQLCTQMYTVILTIVDRVESTR